MAAQREFTRKEVEEYNTKEKGIYFIIHNNVYDVTKFLLEHPGGEEVLIEQAGKDATSEFDDVGHSTDAKESLKNYLVGTLVQTEQSGSDDKKKKKKCCENKEQICIIASASAVAVVAGLFILYKVFKSK